MGVCTLETTPGIPRPPAKAQGPRPSCGRLVTNEQYTSTIARPHGVPDRELGRSGQLWLHTWVFNIWFWGRPEIVDVWGLGGPGGQTNPSKRWGAKPPTVWNGFWGRLGRPDPKNRRFPAGPKNQKPKCAITQPPPPPPIPPLGPGGSLGDCAGLLSPGDLAGKRKQTRGIRERVLMGKCPRTC